MKQNGAQFIDPSLLTIEELLHYADRSDPWVDQLCEVLTKLVKEVERLEGKVYGN